MTALLASSNRHCVILTSGWFSISCIFWITLFVWVNLTLSKINMSFKSDQVAKIKSLSPLLQVSSTSNSFNSLSLRSSFSIRKILLELSLALIGFMRLICCNFSLFSWFVLKQYWYSIKIIILIGINLLRT